MPVPTASPAPAVAANSPHRYDLKDGDKYAYIAAVSEEQRKAGQAAGNVVMFRYLGFRDGSHTVAQLDRRDGIIAKSMCSQPCVIIKNDDGSRTAFSADSVIGSVFADAFAGNLEDSSAASPKASLSAKSASLKLPDSFIGEWNDDPTACGTGTSDSRLVVGPTRISFYESDARVLSTQVNNSREIKVWTSSSGEGSTWKSDMTLVLSPSGQELTVVSGDDSVTRSRCPPLR